MASFGTVFGVRMDSEADLTELLDHGKFTRIESIFRKRFAMGLDVADHDGVRLEKLCSEDSLPEFCRIACGGSEGQNRCRAGRLERVRAAARMVEPVVMSCHAGIVVGCVPLLSREASRGGMFFGRCLQAPVTDAVKDDIVRRGAGPGVDEEMLSAAAGTLRTIEDGELEDAGDFLFDLLYGATGLDVEMVRWGRERSRRKRDVERLVAEQGQQGVTPEYPLEAERELLERVRIADRTGLKEFLDAILAAVLLRSPDRLKMRALELLGLLSRSAMEGGAEIDSVLEKSAGYVEKMHAVVEQWDVCAWLGLALDDYIKLVGSSQDASKIGQVRPAVNYIEANHDKAVTLATVAKAAHLSVSRMAHLFKEQMGMTIIEYLTQVRIEKAKELLLTTDQTCTEVCFTVGYNNQSYFTRTFKNLVGTTPSQFRTKNRRRR